MSSWEPRVWTLPSPLCVWASRENASAQDAFPLLCWLEGTHEVVVAPVYISDKLPRETIWDGSLLSEELLRHKLRLSGGGRAARVSTSSWLSFAAPWFSRDSSVPGCQIYRHKQFFIVFSSYSCNSSRISFLILATSVFSLSPLIFLLFFKGPASSFSNSLPCF